MKKKIISLFIPSFETGGVENNVILFSRILVENGYSVELVYTRANEEKLAKVDPRVVRYRIKSGLRIPLVHPRIMDSINILYTYFRYLKNNRHRIMVLSFQNNIVAIILCRLLKIKVIARVSNHPNASVLDKGLVVKLSAIMKNLFYRYSDCVITNSEITTKKIAGDTGAKVKTIYNPAFSEDILIQAKLPAEDSIFNSSKTLKIIAVGRLVPQKDFSTLIKAFSIVRNNIDAELFIIGDGSEKHSLTQLAKEENIAEYVHFLGFKSNPHTFVARSDLFVLSSRFEGLPNSLIEAVAVGTPAVSTNCLSGPSEILLDGKGGDLVDVGGFEQLAEAIIKNCTDRESALKKHKAAFEALHRFSYDNVSKKIIELVNEYAQ